MRFRLPTALLCCLAGLAVAPGGAAASALQESTFQDDDLLVYAEPAAVGRTLDQLKGLGVDRLRVSVFWAVVAPDPQSQAKPAGFDGADPAAYPAGGWDRYDTLVRLAGARGLGVNFNVTSPAPAWATGSLTGRPDLDKNFAPDATEFGAFVRAVGTRYSGSYTPRQVPTQSPLPRVDYWTVWNEPNQPGWLTPQWTAEPRLGGAFVEAAPGIYRGLLDAMHAGLEATGHGRDTILIGETAPKGQERARGPTRAIKPGGFIRRLYCLDDDLQLLRGTAAAVRGCPTSGSPARFAADHPGLFSATGYAHHPYELTFAPSQRPGPDDFTTGNLGALSSLLRRIHQRYGQLPPGGGRDIPLYLTEFGYQTDPPDPAGVSRAEQAAYLNEAEWITYRNPLVRTLTQFLLVDDKPIAGVTNPIAAFGGTFQSGLMYQNGAAKPALLAYRLPIFLPSRVVRTGRAVRVFGLVRPAANGTVPRVLLQRRTGSGPYRTLKTVRGTAGRGYVDTTFPASRSGAVRLAWRSGATLVTSRQVSFRVTRR